MLQNWRDLDFASFLGLTGFLTDDEIDSLITRLNQEIWFRIFNEELPKLLTAEQFTVFQKQSDWENNIEKIEENLRVMRPDLDLNAVVAKVSLTVKKEYIFAYLEDFRKDYQQKLNQASLLTRLDAIIKELETNSQPDFGKITLDLYDINCFLKAVRARGKS